MDKDSLREILQKRMAELGLDKDKRYVDRLENELHEVEKQNYYKFIEDKLSRKQHGLANYNQLLFWFLLQVTDHFDINEATPTFFEGSCADIDLDFAEGAREKILGFLQSRYGKERACFVGSVGKLKIRSAMLDIGRQLDINPQETFPVTKAIPEDSTLEQLEDNTAAQEYFARHPDMQKYLRYVMNTYRQYGTHAGGILVSSENLMDKCCIVRTAKGPVTGFRESGDTRDLEYIGFIKFDVLGLSTLNQIGECLDILGHKSMNEIPNFTLSDKEVYKKIFWHGKTANVFQLETQLGTEWCKKIRPESIEDLADISTLIRPGCLSAGVPELYHKRKFKKEEYQVHPLLSEITKHTYGLLLYQEQIMQLISSCSKGKIGLSEAYVYLKKIGAGDEKATKSFINKCENLSDDEIRVILEQIVKQSEYSFNKSHSVSYSTISYYQAFLKHYYPLEFWLAALKSVSGNLNKTSYYISCARADGVEVMPVDIMSSDDTYTIRNGKIYCGLQMAKGVKNDVYGLLKSRNERPFTDIADFMKRVRDEEFIFGKRISVPLARIGAFSGLCKNIKRLEEIFCGKKRDMCPDTLDPNAPEYTEEELYDFELNYLGLSLRFDFLARYREELNRSGAISVQHYDMLAEEERICEKPFYGIVNNIARKTTKKLPPREYKIVTIADANQSTSFTVWPTELKAYESMLKRGNLLVVYLTRSQFGNNLQRIPNAIMSVSFA